MNLKELEYDFRRGIGDMGYSESLVIGYFNKAIEAIARNQKLLRDFEGERSWSSVAHQAKYTLPALHTHRDLAVRFDNVPVYPIDKAKLELKGNQSRFVEQTTPEYYGITKNYIEFWPVPGSAADSTTLDGAVTATDTTFTLDSVSGLDEQGRGVIDSEVLSWTHVDSDNLQLTGIVRGLEGTRPAAHLDAATLTERNIILFGGLLPKKFFAAPSRSATAALAANGSACDNGDHAVYISFYSKKWESESLLTSVGTVTVTSSGQINLSNLPASDNGDVSHIRVYMTEAGGSIKYYVTEVAIGTSSYSITTDDTTLAANSEYTIFESDVPFSYRSVITDLALAEWFLDNEQFTRWEVRKREAERKLDGWMGDLERERMTGEIIGGTYR